MKMWNGKKGGGEIILNIISLENYFQFPGAVENDQEVKLGATSNAEAANEV